MDHLAIAVSDQESAQRFYERWDEPDCVSVKVLDPDGNIVEFSWETS